MYNVQSKQMSVKSGFFTKIQTSCKNTFGQKGDSEYQPKFIYYNLKWIWITGRAMSLIITNWFHCWLAQLLLFFSFCKLGIKQYLSLLCSQMKIICQCLVSPETLQKWKVKEYFDIWPYGFNKKETE